MGLSHPPAAVAMASNSLAVLHRNIASLCCLLFALCASPQASALTASEVFRRVSPSVVIVVVLDSVGSAVGYGSGVVVARDRVITNCHVVEEGRSIVVVRGDRRTSARIIDRDTTSLDLCMLATTTGDAPIVRLRPMNGLEIGESVYSIGAPLGLDKTLSPGLISGLRAVGGAGLVQTTAPISPGSSGGGLFDEAGFLVGVTTGSLEEGQNLNFAGSSGNRVGDSGAF